MRKVVIVPLFGDYDELKAPLVSSDGWEYFVVTDKKRNDNFYTDVVVSLPFDSKRNTGMVITQPYLFVTADIYVVVGAQMEIKFDLNTIINFEEDIKFLYSDVKGFYEEAIRCIQYKTDDVLIIGEQVQNYFEKGLPDNTGMVATGFTIRKHSDKMAKFGAFWFAQILRYSKRDQLSFNYIAWKYPDLIKYSCFDDAFWNNFNVTNHK